MKILKNTISGFLSSIILLSTKVALATSTTINVPNPIGATSTIEIINRITNYLMWIAIVSAPMMIIVAAFTFLTSGGNERKVATAKKMLMWAIIGIALVVVSKGVVSLIREFLV